MSMFNTIFNKVLVFLRLKAPSVDSTCTPIRHSRLLWDFQMFHIEDHDRRSRLVDLYYVFYRFFHNSPYGNPRQAYREVKWFIQRGRDGYADCDVWSLDDYLNGWLPAALRRLKKTKHGVPCAMFEPEDCSEVLGTPTDIGMDAAEARWNAIMDKMIEGFEADRRAQEGLYEEELGPYPMNRPSGVSAAAWEKVKRDRRKAAEELTKRDEALSEEGRALFMKHWHSLWD